MLLFYFCIANIRKKIGLAKFASPILLFFNVLSLLSSSLNSFDCTIRKWNCALSYVTTKYNLKTVGISTTTNGCSFSLKSTKSAKHQVRTVSSCYNSYITSKCKVIKVSVQASVIFTTDVESQAVSTIFVTVILNN